MWEDLFRSSEIERLSIATKEDIEEIIEMLIRDKIDPQIFITNLTALLRGGIPSFNDFLLKKENNQLTSSINYCVEPGHRASAFPLWFYAAYPDVMVWFHEWRKGYGRSHDYNDDAMAIETAKLFGIDIEDETLEEDQILNRRGENRPKYLKNLVKNYKAATKKTLEGKRKRHWF